MKIQIVGANYTFQLLPKSHYKCTSHVVSYFFIICTVLGILAGFWPASRTEISVKYPITSDVLFHVKISVQL